MLAIYCIIKLCYVAFVDDKWKRGRWSKQEIDILKRNVKAFMKVSH